MLPAFKPINRPHIRPVVEKSSIKSNKKLFEQVQSKFTCDAFDE